MIRKLKIFIVTLTLLFLETGISIAPGLTSASKSAEINLTLNYKEQLRCNKELNGFIDQLGFDESRHDWLQINEIGAFGEFQFINSTLREIGYGHITLRKFKLNPYTFPKEMQREAVESLINYNSIIMWPWIDKYDGKVINGVKITKAGILAACHLGGPYSTILFLDSNGIINRRDIFKTTIGHYLFFYQTFNLNLKLTQVYG